eukprot:2391647-Rhodomonas_salina.1
MRHRAYEHLVLTRVRCCGTSEGGHATVCTSCVPVHSTVVQQCDYTCNAGYFGQGCLPCSQSELAVTSLLPRNASWVDGQPTCRWVPSPPSP